MVQSSDYESIYSLMMFI